MKIKATRRKENLAGWFLAVPLLCSVCVFILYPIVYSTVLSLTDVKYVVGSQLNFIGFKNYAMLFTSYAKTYFGALWLSVRFSLLTTAIQTLLGLVVAYALYDMNKTVQGILRVLVYMPAILPGTVISVMWQFIFVPNVGLLDKLFALCGNTNPPQWLGSEHWLFASIVFVNTWRFLGTTVIIYLMNMNTIDKSVLESAKLDGASKVQTLWHFILPLTFSATKINIMLSLLGGIKSFDLFYLLGNGKEGSRVVGYIIFQTAFGMQTNLSLATAMSVVLTLILGVLMFLVNYFMGKRSEKYD